MKPTAQDEHRIRAAEGWLDLDHPVEAAEELEKVAPQHRAHPAILLLRCQIYLAVHKPDHTQVIATTLTEQLPEVPDGWFYLACAYSRLNQNGEARAALKQCFVAAAKRDSEKEWQERALAARDLEALW
jgi:predicted Zn-dependent protease